MRARRRNRRSIYIGLVIFTAVFVLSFLMQKFRSDDGVEAASLVGFDPGYIISDYQMSNYNSMSEVEIQNFLTAKNSCNNRDYGVYQTIVARYPSINWHWDNGHFVCLSEERFGDGETIGSGDTAAHIIWQAAQDYRINPQVLIVLLQKEQGLITDDAPNSIQYRSATGYGCPDTAPCSSQYYGFKNQVRKAAALFRTVLDGGWTNYPLGDNYIQYNPNAGCGGSVVNIRSLATSALYRYTPYQPNAGALAAGYGTAYCGAYGNRNFYLYFEDWFGGVTSEGSNKSPQLTFENMPKVAKEETDLGMEYSVHVANYGWLSVVGGGEMAGTVGYSLRMEALSIKLKDMAGIEYRTYVENEGWGEYKKDGEISGSTGKSQRVEAVQIRLTGGLENDYDIYYRVHACGIGWMDWVENGEIAGTTGQGRQVEAIQIKIVKKSPRVNIKYRAHVANIGWMDWVENGEIAGTTGQSRRVEAFTIELSGEGNIKNDIKYRAHVANIGWMDWVENGEIAGTTGQSRRVEAFTIELSGSLKDQYKIRYRAHVEGYGWMEWMENGEIAGTTGQGRQVEAIQMEIVGK